MLKAMQAEQFNTVYLIMQESFPLDEFRPYEEQFEAFVGRVYREVYGAQR